MFPRPCLLLCVVLVRGAGLTVLQSIQGQFHPPHLLLLGQMNHPSEPSKPNNHLPNASLAVSLSSSALEQTPSSYIIIVIVIVSSSALYSNPTAYTD